MISCRGKVFNHHWSQLACQRLTEQEKDWSHTRLAHCYNSLLTGYLSI
jgi:hypothetical protein